MKTDCYEQLEKRLVKTRFRQEADQWKKDLQDLHDGRKQMQDLRFILKSDCENFNKFQNGFARKNKTRDTFLHPEVLPQPFIGTPCAPVWYLLLNPGYSFLDRYDHLGILPNQEKYEISAGSNSAELLSKRQELLIDSRARPLTKGSRSCGMGEKGYVRLTVLPGTGSYGGRSVRERKFITYEPAASNAA